MKILGMNVPERRVSRCSHRSSRNRKEDHMAEARRSRGGWWEMGLGVAPRLIPRDLTGPSED